MVVTTRGGEKNKERRDQQSTSTQVNHYSPSKETASPSDTLEFELGLSDQTKKSAKIPRTPPKGNPVNEQSKLVNPLSIDSINENTSKIFNEYTIPIESQNNFASTENLIEFETTPLINTNLNSRGVITSPSSNMPSDNDNTTSSITRLPPFNKNDPDLWFNQVERLFTRNKIIAEADKADVLIAAVDSDILTCVRCVVLKQPPPENIYTQIKEGLLSNFAVSNEL